MSSSWMRMAPNPMATVFLREEKDLDTQHEACEDWGRGWKDAATSRGTGWGDRELGEARGSFFRASGEIVVHGAWISGCPQHWEGEIPVV